MDPVTPEQHPITYSLRLSEGWSRIRLDDHADPDVKVLLDTAFAGIPEEAADLTRSALAGRFATQIAAARAKRGLHLYLPTPRPHAQPLPVAAILTAEVVIPAPVVPDPVEVVARVAAAKPGSRTGVIAGSPAVRIDHTADDQDEGETAGPKRVEYVIAVPGDPRWLSIDLSVQGSDDFDADATIAGFDQMVADLAWT